MRTATTVLHETTLRSETTEVVLGHSRRFCIIGERINPTGRKIFQEQLRNGDMYAIERDVIAQVDGGADVLDVNMGVPLTDGRRALALPCDEGEYAAYWAVDAADKPICLVVDFDAFTQKDWKARAI